MKLSGQWFQLPNDKRAEAKAAAAIEQVNLSEWIADAVIRKLQISRANAKGKQNENEKSETSEF